MEYRDDPEQVAMRLRHENRAAYQTALDVLMRGNAIARAALELRYRPIHQFQKEGPHVGFREEAESEAGRVN